MSPSRLTCVSTVGLDLRIYGGDNYATVGTVTSVVLYEYLNSTQHIK